MGDAMGMRQGRSYGDAMENAIGDATDGGSGGCVGMGGAGGSLGQQGGCGQYRHGCGRESTRVAGAGFAQRTLVPFWPMRWSYG